MTFKLKKQTNFKVQGMEDLLNTDQLRLLPLPSLEKAFKAVFKGEPAHIWISRFQQSGTNCIYKQQQFMQASICQMCSKIGDSLFTEDNRFKIKESRCSNLLGACMNFWRQLIDIQEEFSKIEVDKKLGINVHGSTLVEAISRNGDFWKIVRQEKPDQKSQAVLCEGFLNVLSKAPPILRTKEVKQMIGSLNTVVYNVKKSKDQDQGRELCLCSSACRFLGDVYVYSCAHANKRRNRNKVHYKPYNYVEAF